jgi:hypothetical protein
MEIRFSDIRRTKKGNVVADLFLEGIKFCTCGNSATWC